MNEYEGMCNQKVKDSFRSLNTYFTIILVIASICVVTFIISIAINSMYDDLWNPYGDIIPPYIGIAIMVIFIVCIFAIGVAKSLRNQICKNDGYGHGLLGSGL